MAQLVEEGPRLPKRQKVLFLDEVKDIAAMHRQAIHPSCQLHEVPTTPEEIDRSERIVEKMIALKTDPDLASYFAGISTILLMLKHGEITDEQFLQIYNASNYSE